MAILSRFYLDRPVFVFLLNLWKGNLQYVAKNVKYCKEKIILMLELSIQLSLPVVIKAQKKAEESKNIRYVFESEGDLHLFQIKVRIS